MRTLLDCSAAMTLILALAGCNNMLVGTWEAKGAPAKDDDFFITNATFNDGGTYQAVAKKGEESIRLAGTYDFDGFRLKLKSPGKQERTYSATYVMMGHQLQLRHDGKSQTLKRK